ncbi:Stealth CR1 domain-containing protein [Glaesserella parasuis]|uniref:Stealth CR1 domain-containing protein n=1 Tax=Glaesserella parasuis TaxID=738 RepID=UPI003854FE6F
MKIDFVLPWVNPLDREWQAKKSFYSNINLKETSSNSESRYRDMGTLRYVLRSIEKNCPWYNRIYLITEGHFPEWLDINNEKIFLITHNQLYYEKEHLPIFNSSSIEMNLGNIDALSENFVYLNDDMIIMRGVNKERFFFHDKPVDFLTHGWIPRNKIYFWLRNSDVWVNSLLNNLNLVNSQCNLEKIDKSMLYHESYSVKDKLSNFLFFNIYKKAFWLEHWHHPQPYNKRTLLSVRELFSKEMSICSANKFRDKSDLTQYLYRYWHLLNGDFYPKKHYDGIERNLSSIEKLLEMIDSIESNQNIKFACFNDSPYLSDENYNEVKGALMDYLNKKFPTKASFEL